MPKLTVSPLNVKLFAPLSAAAFKKKVIDELALWHCLRAINTNGSGVLDFEKALEALEQYFSYKPRSAYRHLNKGNGSLWELVYLSGRRRIRIYSLKTTSQYLDTYLMGDSHARLVPVAAFRSNTMRRAQIYASIHNPGGVKAYPKSRNAIEEQTGLSKTQQRRYETVAQIKRTPTYAVSLTEKGEVVPVKQDIHSKAKGHRQVNKRLGNIYHSRQAPGCKGQTGKVRRSLRQRSLLAKEAPNLLRRFFTGLRQLTRCKNRRWDSYYLLRSTRRIIKGRLEWLYSPTI